MLMFAKKIDTSSAPAPKLQRNAVIAVLSIHQWTSRKKDEDVGREVAANHNAAKNAITIWKKVMENPIINDLARIRAEAGKYHRYVTTPWERGKGLLHVKKHKEYSNKMEFWRLEHANLAEQLILQFTVLVENEKRRLNGLWKQRDYPLPDRLIEMFGFQYRFEPIPDANDMRVNLSQQEVEVLRQQWEALEKDRLAKAEAEIWTRIQVKLQKVVKTLSDPNKQFHKTLMEDIKRLIEVVPYLNLTGNIEIESVCQDIEDTVIRPVKELRKSVSERANTAKSAEEILEKVTGILVTTS